MKGKRERRARQPPLARGAAIPGACGEQRLEGAQFEGVESDTESLFRGCNARRREESRDTTGWHDDKIKPSFKKKKQTEKTQLTDLSISIASCSRLTHRHEGLILMTRGHSSRHEGKLICDRFLMSSLTRLPQPNAVRHVDRRINSVLITVINQDVRLFMGHTPHKKKERREKKRTPCSDDSQTQT